MSKPIPEKINNVDTYLEEYKNLIDVFDVAQEKYLTNGEVDTEKYVECLTRSSVMIRFLDELSSNKKAEYPEQVKTTYYISAEILVRTVGLHMNRSEFNEKEKGTLYTAIAHVRKTLDVEPFHKKGMDLFKLVFLYLTMFNPNIEENIALLNQVLMFAPCDYQLHYNFGFMYHRGNKLDNSLYHYKLALGIIELLEKNASEEEKKSTKQFKIKCLNGMGNVYFTVQNRDLALYFFNLAYDLDPTDPDINNQIAVVYTELRYTDKAIKHYNIAAKNYKSAHISVDKEMLIASINMNMGLAKCYECDFTGAIECYNQALKYKPRLSLAYQNKLLDLNYISHLIEDPMYIARLHKAINKIYPEVISDYKVGCPDYVVKKEILGAENKQELMKTGTKLKIGFVSGDFICHPVAYFIHSILNNINYDLFDVHCYSAKVVNIEGMFPKCKIFVVKNLSSKEFKSMIQSHGVDVLFDLSAHTGDNRLDTFALKPAPIQISYCGYPNSSGLRSMDYRITDKICDSEKSQKYYQEKLVFMDKSFLAYTPSTGIKNPPKLGEQPCKKNGYITFGCFNRYNKVNSMVAGVWEKLLIAIPNAKFVIKTKEFLTPKIKSQFLSYFKNADVLNRIEILPYADSYEEHLLDYNKMDIALDTFPYS